MSLKRTKSFDKNALVGLAEATGAKGVKNAMYNNKRQKLSLPKINMCSKTLLNQLVMLASEEDENKKHTNQAALSTFFKSLKLPVPQNSEITPEYFQDESFKHAFKNFCKDADEKLDELDEELAASLRERIKKRDRIKKQKLQYQLMLRAHYPELSMNEVMGMRMYDGNPLQYHTAPCPPLSVPLYISRKFERDLRLGQDITSDSYKNHFIITGHDMTDLDLLDFFRLGSSKVQNVYYPALNDKGLIYNIIKPVPEGSLSYINTIKKFVEDMRKDTMSDEDTTSVDLNQASIDGFEVYIYGLDLFKEYTRVNYEYRGKDVIVTCKRARDKGDDEEKFNFQESADAFEDYGTLPVGNVGRGGSRTNHHGSYPFSDPNDNGDLGNVTDLDINESDSVQIKLQKITAGISKGSEYTFSLLNDQWPSYSDEVKQKLVSMIKDSGHQGVITSSEDKYANIKNALDSLYVSPESMEVDSSSTSLSTNNIFATLEIKDNDDSKLRALEDLIKQSNFGEKINLGQLLQKRTNFETIAQFVKNNSMQFPNIFSLIKSIERGQGIADQFSGEKSTTPTPTPTPTPNSISTSNLESFENQYRAFMQKAENERREEEAKSILQALINVGDYDNLPDNFASIFNDENYAWIAREDAFADYKKFLDGSKQKADPEQF